MKTHFKITNSHSLYPTKYTRFKLNQVTSDSSISVPFGNKR